MTNSDKILKSSNHHIATYTTKSSTTESFLEIIANGFRSFCIAIVTMTIVVLLIDHLSGLIQITLNRRQFAVLHFDFIVSSRCILLLRFNHCGFIVVFVSMSRLNRRLLTHSLHTHDSSTKLFIRTLGFALHKTIETSSYRFRRSMPHTKIKKKKLQFNCHRSFSVQFHKNQIFMRNTFETSNTAISSLFSFRLFFPSSSVPRNG